MTVPISVSPEGNVNLIWTSLPVRFFTEYLCVTDRDPFTGEVGMGGTKRVDILPVVSLFQTT